MQDDDNSFILIDFNKDKKEYHNHFKVYNLIKDINISIPKIIDFNDDNLIIITQDFGKLRYDKIFEKFNLKDMLQYAVDTLIIIDNTIQHNEKYNLPIYSFNILKKEIMELEDFYLPYKKINRFSDITNEFISLWKNAYDEYNFKFNKLSHKDFIFNNLLLLPHKKGHLKCGVIDFQSSYWGESCWDLFSLLEDSRINYDDQFNDSFIDYFYVNTNQQISLEDFKSRFYFLNCSRQTRLLGRWVKLYKESNDDTYLSFIPITLNRLKKSLKTLNNDKLNYFYDNYVFLNE